jgi:hypothetical protein
MSTTIMKNAKTLITYAIIVLDKILHDVSLPIHHAPTGVATLTSSFPHHIERMIE